MNKHKSNEIKENSNTVRHLIMGEITTTQNLVAIKEVRHAGQKIEKKKGWGEGVGIVDILIYFKYTIIVVYISLLRYTSNTIFFSNYCTS